MLRVIGAVFGGYLALFVTVFVTLTVAYLLMGADRAFQPGTYDVTLPWIVAYLAFSLLAAVVGGAVATRISTDPRVPGFLAGLVFVLGLISALQVYNAMQLPSLPRLSDVSSINAMMSARTPLWAMLLNPILGVVGVMIGARRRSLR
jgi:hypothetical protein